MSRPARIDPLAHIAEGASIGPGTTVWQFVVVLDGAAIGADCNLSAHTLVEGGAVLGDRVTLKSGVYVWDGITLEDDVFCGPNATFANDRYPRSKQPFKLEGLLRARIAVVREGGVRTAEYVVLERDSVPDVNA